MHTKCEYDIDDIVRSDYQDDVNFTFYMKCHLNVLNFNCTLTFFIYLFIFFATFCNKIFGTQNLI